MLPTGEVVVSENPPELLLTTGEVRAVAGCQIGSAALTACAQTVKLRGKAVYFIRLSSKGVSDKTVEQARREPPPRLRAARAYASRVLSLQDIACGELAGSALDAFRTLMNDLYLPILREQDQAWGVAPEDAAGDFLQGSARLVSVLGEAANSLLGGVELRKCDKRFGGDTEEPTPALCSKLAADSEALQHFDAVLADWCTQTDRLIQDSDNARREPDDAGPNTELSFWRDRMAKLNSVLEQLKGRGARLVLETCIVANSPSVSTWRAVEGRHVLPLQLTSLLCLQLTRAHPLPAE